MSWATVQEAVRDWVAGALELEDFTGGRGTPVPRVEWENRSSAQRYQRGGPWVDLRISNVVGKGQDETRYEFLDNADPTLARNVPTYGGYRLFTVTVKIGSDSQEPVDSAVSTLAGKLRTRLRRRDILAVLQAANAALVTIGPTIDVDYVDHDGRMMSYAITDIRLATTEQDTDSDSDGDWVESAAGEGTLTDIDDTELDADFDTAD